MDNRVVAIGLLGLVILIVFGIVALIYFKLLNIFTKRQGKIFIPRNNPKLDFMKIVMEDSAQFLIEKIYFLSFSIDKYLVYYRRGKQILFVLC